MTYDLYIGDRTFSSWSMRGWLMLRKSGQDFRTHSVGLYSGTMAADLAPLAPARLVPALRTPQGEVIGESLAIAETLAERHPQAGLWPADPGLRIKARWLCAEMASGFSALRSTCPMQLQHVNKGFSAPQAVLADLARLETLMAWARTDNDGWIFGEYTLADVFYTPVAARITGYDLPVSDALAQWCKSALTDPDVLAWREEGLRQVYDPFPYPTDCPTADWPW